MDRFSEESPLTYAEAKDEPAFFVMDFPCESCGRPVEERVPAYWQPDLLVGPCCMAHEDDVCPAFLQQVEACKTVAAVSALFREHMATCGHCAQIDMLGKAA